jgi:hypothetical protein
MIYLSIVIPKHLNDETVAISARLDNPVDTLED